jgi:hypothetical protein
VRLGTLLALLLATALPAWPAPGVAGDIVTLAAAGWSVDGLEPETPPAVEGLDEQAAVRLPFARRNVRWATQFETVEPGTARLVLHWRGGPDGLLHEVVLDGQRLPPPRDGWRPSSRDLSTDLGSRWLGEGRHLLEFVAREQAAPDACLRLRALELRWL